MYITNYRNICLSIYIYIYVYVFAALGRLDALAHCCGGQFFTLLLPNLGTVALGILTGARKLRKQTAFWALLEIVDHEFTYSWDPGRYPKA